MEMDRLASECENIEGTLDMLVPWLNLDVPVEEIGQLSQARCWTGLIPSQHSRTGQGESERTGGGGSDDRHSGGNKNACMIVALNEIAEEVPEGPADDRVRGPSASKG